MKRPSFKTIIRTSACFAALATLGMGFQNCAGKGFETVKLEEPVLEIDPLALPVTSGILFKRQYEAPAAVAAGTAGVVADAIDCGTENIDSMIEVRNDGNIYLLRENCKNLDKALKLDIYKTAFLPHNAIHMIYNGKLFRADIATIPLDEGETLPDDVNYKTDVLCRVELVDNGTRRVTDVRTFIGADSKPMVKIVVADYRNGAVVDSYMSAFMETERTFDQDNKTLDAAKLTAPDNFSLLLDTNGAIEQGEISYSKSVFGTHAPAGYVDGETYSSPGMNCYR